MVAKLGPLSYLVETQDEQLWRRHLDHLKQLIVPVSPQPVLESAVEDWDLELAPAPAPVLVEVPGVVLEETLMSPLSLRFLPRLLLNPPAVVPTETAASPSSERRYPARD